MNAQARARVCKTCGKDFTARYWLALHYADDHGLDKYGIATAMGYAPQSVSPMLSIARAKQEQRRQVSE